MAKRGEIVSKSREAAGLKSTSLYLNDEARELLARVAKSRGLSKSAAVVMGLQLLDGGDPEPTDAQLLAMLKARLAER